MSKERVYVVDEHDNILKEKWRSETTPNDRIRIVAIWVYNNRDEVLIAKRAKTKKLHPGLWGPSAAGGVTVGEDYKAAAKKELFEELGLDIAHDNLELAEVDKYLYGTEAPDDGLRMLAVFAVNTSWKLNQFTYPEDEVAEIKWIKKSDLKNDITNNPEKYLPHSQSWFRFL